RLPYEDQKVRGFHTSPDGILSQSSVYEPRVRQQIEAGVEVQSKVARVYQTDGFGGFAALQHPIEPRAQIIAILGYNQKSNPTYDPGYSTGTGIDPGYERNHGIDRIGLANEGTYYPTNVLAAKTDAGPARG